MCDVTVLMGSHNGHIGQSESWPAFSDTFSFSFSFRLPLSVSVSVSTFSFSFQFQQSTFSEANFQSDFQSELFSDSLTHSTIIFVRASRAFLARHIQICMDCATFSKFLGRCCNFEPKLSSRPFDQMHIMLQNTENDGNRHFWMTLFYCSS